MNTPTPIHNPQGNSCCKHESYEDLTHHMEKIREHLKLQLQSSVKEKKSSVCRVLTGMRKITGIAVLGAVATAGVIGLAPVIASATGASLPAGFVGGALFNWVNDFGVGAVSAWTVETAKQAMKGDTGDPDQFLKKESQKVINRILLGDAEFLIGILKMIEDNNLLDNNLLEDFEREMLYLNAVSSGHQNSAEISEGIKAAKEWISKDMLLKIKNLRDENAKLRDENQQLLFENEFLTAQDQRNAEQQLSAKIIDELQSQNVRLEEMIASLHRLYSPQPTVVSHPQPTVVSHPPSDSPPLGGSVPNPPPIHNPPSTDYDRFRQQQSN